MLREWQEIADFLRVHVSTAKRWEKEKKLPIYRPGGKGGGKKPRVTALKQELYQWVRQDKQGPRRMS